MLYKRGSHEIWEFSIHIWLGLTEFNGRDARVSKGQTSATYLVEISDTNFPHLGFVANNPSVMSVGATAS